MMFPKNRIRLSRTLRSHTNPYPAVGRWLKRGLVMISILLALGIYYFARPQGGSDNTNQAQFPDESKQILGENEESDNQYLIYEIKRGDTLFNLSQKYSISWQTLAEINNLSEPYVLKIGQELKIPQ